MRTFFCACLTAAAFSSPAVVRTLFMDAGRMESVRPAMGRSTVLRFPEKPDRVIVGNQNYYKIEFTGDDLTIQPQGTVPTNLFVYTEGKVYGFILSPVEGGGYDDLVVVRPKRKPKEPPFPVGVEIVEIEERTLGRGLATLSLVLTNNGKTATGRGDVRLFVARGKKRILPQKTYFEKDVWEPGETARAKIVFVPPKEKKAVLNVRLFGQTSKEEIEWED